MKQRIRAVMNYLSWADPFYKWKVSTAECPLDGKSKFISLKADPFMTRCLKCKGNVTNLSLIPLVKEHVNGNYDKAVYELSTYGSTLDFMKTKFQNITTSEFFMGREPGETVNGVMNQDVMRLTFTNNSFDIVTSNQVFEHVPDDIRGFRECYRVLRKGGALIFTVPLHDAPATVKKAAIVDGKIEYYGTPEYHDSRLEGPAHHLCFITTHPTIFVTG